MHRKIQIHKVTEKMNHPMYLHDVEIFAKKKKSKKPLYKQLEYSLDKGREFGVGKNVPCSSWKI